MDNMTLYIENPKETIKNTIKINELRQEKKKPFFFYLEQGQP